MTDKERIERLEIVLGALISWMGQSFGCPLGRSEIEELLDMLGEDDHD